MLISENYKEQNKVLHENPAYGVSSAKLVGNIHAIFNESGCKTLLDYGCGKGYVRKALGAFVSEYDPAINGKDGIPAPADMVTCIDVLEHIEPECLDAVLDDLRRCMLKVGYFTIETRPAMKVLPDGRNAHLIQESYAWWLPKIMDRFDLIQFVNLNGKFLVIVRAK